MAVFPTNSSKCILGSLETIVAGEQLELLPGRAVWMPGRETLLIADTHFGKAATFRSQSIPLPGGDTKRDLERLSKLLETTGAKKLIVLGDFYHAREGRTVWVEAQLADWRSRWKALDMVLVRGNHDRHAGDPPVAWQIQVVDELRFDPFILRHEPIGFPEKTLQNGDAGPFELAGHIHPAVRLRGPGRDAVRLPCFWFGETSGLLPAFGSFTGGHTLRPRPKDRVFVIADTEVVAVGSSRGKRG